LEELAASDGRILIECMPITLLDEAVRHFSNQPGKLRSFGKCIRSLIGFSSSLYEIGLPNMRKLEIDRDLLFEGMDREDDGDFSRMVNSWPKLEEIQIASMTYHTEDYVKKLLFGSGVLRPSVQRFDCDMKLQPLSSDAAHFVDKLPNLTQLRLRGGTESGESFRNLMRRLPSSCPKISHLDIEASDRLGDVDFLGDEDEELPPLLQLRGKL
jgi:hypothetical protein